MLAHNGLALITEKLQNQRLEEPVVQSNTGASRVPAGYDSSASKAMGPTTRSNLAVKGKNVWALSVESERPGGRESQHGFTSVASTESTAVGTTASSTPRPPTLPRPIQVSERATHTAWNCRHKKLRQSCQLCESCTPGTPSAPPKKKHCRSLSVPPDSSFSGTGVFLPSAVPRVPPFSTISKETESGRLWKPIAVIPLSGRPNSVRDKPELHGAGTSWQLPKLPDAGLKLLPSASAASCSSDSGHFTTSDLQTPPGSPLGGVIVPAPPHIPRPSSAASDTGSSSPWFDWGPSSSSIVTTGGFGRNLRAGVRTLQNRSLSCEDRISGCSSSSSSCSSPYASSSGMVSTTVCNSGAAGSGSIMTSAAVTPRFRSGSHDVGLGDGICSRNIPRCHSQPCVLHHRRCGKKRRRNCDRPTLNFNKMTETAYNIRGNRSSEPWSMPVFTHQSNLLGLHKPVNSGGSGPGTAGRLGFALNPIASSPLDSDLPSDMATKLTLSSQRDLDLRHAASVALPLTPPDQASPTLAHRHDNNDEDGDEEEEEDGEEEEEEEEDEDHTNCRCHNRRTDDDVGLLFPIIDLDLEQIENH